VGLDHGLSQGRHYQEYDRHDLTGGLDPAFFHCPPPSPPLRICGRREGT
jgi:hypothetical protein